MQTLIYKTELTVERSPAWLAPNSPVELRPQAEGTVVAFARRPSRWSSFWGEARPVRIGVLNEEVAMLLSPLLETGIALRVRIVELHPAHLTVEHRARISVSVWGPGPKMAEFRTFAAAGYP